MFSGLLQGFGLGCTFVPLNTLALSTLPRHILTQGTAIRSLMRNVGGSIGISILVGADPEHPDRAFAAGRASAPGQPAGAGAVPGAALQPDRPEGSAALNAEVTRQAAMVAYINDFALMMALVIASIPLLLLVRRQERKAR